MKTLFKLSLIAVIVLATASCSSSKKVSGGQEITLPFADAKYQSDKKFFRAVQSGSSVDLATSKKVALANANSELAGKVQTLVKAVTDQYTNQRTVGDAQAFENKFEEMARLVVNQKLQDITTIGQKTFKEKDGRYTYWIAIEMSKDALIEEVKSRVSNDEQLKLDFDKAQFEKIFNEEMEKFAKEQGR